ncbi:hypothetical protein ACHAW5_004789 [Stephanodiscus triporus]|uniref:Uncharacterized protein n=1 Tax=Stephanodiscus triporus TaxID=2934178 RepID=A0ABD3N1V9_9STRA
MPGWFDLYDWPIGLDAKDDRDGILSVVRQVEETAKRLEREMGIHSPRGAVALLAAYHRRGDKAPFAGCVCLSGWLTLGEDLATVADDAPRSTPLFWGHGRWDDKVLFEQQAHGVGRLREVGVDLPPERNAVDGRVLGEGAIPSK